MFQAGSENAPVGTAALRTVLNKPLLAPLVRRVGAGRTVTLPGLAEDRNVLLRALAALFRDTPSYLEGIKPLAPADGQLDNKFATTTDTGVLRYDGEQARITP